MVRSLPRSHLLSPLFLFRRPLLFERLTGFLGVSGRWSFGGHLATIERDVPAPRPCLLLASGDTSVTPVSGCRIQRQDCIFMAFGQQQGPPASASQVRELLTLLQEAGHSDFRDARGPMGFTQRQAAGKFTRTEADELLERLRNSEPEQSMEVPIWRRTVQSDLLNQIPDERLAVELRRRGWTVVEPFS